MNQAMKNKEFILHYYNAVSGVIKTPALLRQFIDDPALIDGVTFIDGAFPGYEMTAEEMTAEGNRVVVRARMKGKHEGEWDGILPTHRQVEFPVVVGYEIVNNKIATHWIISDSAMLMEQLGIDTMSKPGTE
ncbi:ester cyclase [Spirosoma areae]